jgi:hypothetical protein
MSILYPPLSFAYLAVSPSTQMGLENGLFGSGAKLVEERFLDVKGLPRNKADSVAFDYPNKPVDLLGCVHTSTSCVWRMELTGSTFTPSVASVHSVLKLIPELRIFSVARVFGMVAFAAAF